MRRWCHDMSWPSEFVEMSSDAPPQWNATIDLTTHCKWMRIWDDGPNVWAYQSLSTTPWETCIGGKLVRGGPQKPKLMASLSVDAGNLRGLIWLTCSVCIVADSWLSVLLLQMMCSFRKQFVSMTVAALAASYHCACISTAMFTRRSTTCRTTIESKREAHLLEFNGNTSLNWAVISLKCSCAIYPVYLLEAGFPARKTADSSGSWEPEITLKHCLPIFHTDVGPVVLHEIRVQPVYLDMFQYTYILRTVYWTHICILLLGMLSPDLGVVIRDNWRNKRHTLTHTQVGAAHIVDLIFLLTNSRHRSGKKSNVSEDVVGVELILVLVNEW